MGQNRVVFKYCRWNPPPSDRMLTSYKKKRIVGHPKATTKIHIPRKSFQPSHTEENITKRSDLCQLSDLISLTSCKLATFFPIWGDGLGETRLVLLLLEKFNSLARFLTQVFARDFRQGKLCCDSSAAGWKERSLLAAVHLCIQRIILNPTKMEIWHWSKLV